MKLRLSIVSAAALALAACGGQDEAAEAPAAEDTMAMAPEPAVDAAPDPATPQGFVATAASSDMYEIEAGRLAQDMGTSDAIKAFGAMMVEDHTASSAKLKTAAASASGVTVPAEMLPKHQQNLEALRSAGGNFDTVYAQQQVAAHQEALALLQSQAQTGTEASLKAFAAETAPIVEGHLGQAQDLAGAAGGAAGGA